MNNKQSLSANITLMEAEKYKSFVVEFKEEIIANWCLGICLLDDAMIDYLIIIDINSPINIKIMLEKRIKKQYRASLIIIGNDIQLLLSATELKYWKSFFLKYYRDGVSNVDHIDIETSPVDKNIGEVDVTLKVSNTLPPVSAEEVRRRLGL